MLRVRAPRIASISGAINGTASGTFSLSGNATGTVIINGVTSGSFPLSGSSTGTVIINGISSGNFPLSGSSTGVVGTATTNGVVSGTFPLSGNSTGTIPINGAANGNLPLTGEATGAGALNGIVAGLFGLFGSTTGTSGGQTLNPNGGGRREYQPYYYELQNRRKFERKFQEAELNLKETENKIETLEIKRTRNLADEAMQVELLGLLKQQNELMQLIKELQQQKLKVISDDEEVMMLLIRLIN